MLPMQAGDAVRAQTISQIRRPPTEPLRPTRAVVNDPNEDADTETFLRGNGRNRRIRRGLMPQTRTGWIAAAVIVAGGLLALAVGAYFAARYALNSPKFRIPSSASITLGGNTHVSQSQMLSIFGGDVDRSIFRVPLEQRRAELEAMPWVAHATVMRLLPNRLRVDVTERVPVAFVRRGGVIGLADQDGVLLDIPPDAGGSGNYSFPVVTGLRAEDSAADRAERMKLYAAFLTDLDSDGKGTSAQLSEIDLSNPEDVKALVPDHNSEILVHFGTEHFLDRYRRFQEHITEWRTQYPRLSGVDMRYERQVVLQMPPKDAALQPGAAPQTAENHPVVPSHAAASVAGHGPTSALSSATHTPSNTTPQATTLHRAAAAKPHTAANEAATRKRVEAIKQWMARREKARAAAHLAN